MARPAWRPTLGTVGSAPAARREAGSSKQMPRTRYMTSCWFPVSNSTLASQFPAQHLLESSIAGTSEEPPATTEGGSAMVGCGGRSICCCREAGTWASPPRRVLALPPAPRGPSCRPEAQARSEQTVRAPEGHPPLWEVLCRAQSLAGFPCRLKVPPGRKLRPEPWRRAWARTLEADQDSMRPAPVDGGGPAGCAPGTA